MSVLHPSHQWGQRPIFEREAPGSNRLRERKIPCCLRCLVDGYEDEPAAFEPCPRPATTTTDGAAVPEGDTHA
ncbi:hypothetical protein [Pimelobacter simplex]|uniref:hypothetical protein n=1 Tax=Nocardioides simplex TaxID=2045 RepID=UPI00214FBF0A|nr:hypothetical protein [Pimelobacter simplex]UUW88375.1 hypothetical protein M0M43_21885 [Pimelobacter simplex]UUW97879.1 hypothetical protein M0M48_10530 [Pimelobacter simplex]